MTYTNYAWFLTLECWKLDCLISTMIYSNTLKERVWIKCLRLSLVMMNLWPYAVLAVSLLRFFLRRRGDWTQAILKSNIWHSKNINKQKRCYHALDGAAVNSRPPASSSNPVWTGTVNHFKPSSSNQGNLAGKMMVAYLAIVPWTQILNRSVIDNISLK